MLNHYFKIAIRNIFRNKVFSLINIVGLAVGMGVCLLIYQYIHFELSYDRFHSNVPDIYRVTLDMIKDGKEIGTSVRTGHALAVRGEEDIPEIEQFVRIYPDDEGAVITNPEKNEVFEEDNILFVDHNFLQMFDFPLRLGDRESALDEKNHIVISERMGTKYFGDANPVGKVLIVNSSQNKIACTVAGVLEALPINSHFQFDFLLPIEVILETEQYQGNTGGWGWTNFVTYIKVNEMANMEEVGEKFDRVITTYGEAVLARFSLQWETVFQPLVDIHLRSGHLKGDPASNHGDIQNVRLFLIIAVFILLMAWINYINLSTARAIHKAKEVGVRKSIGAARTQLISQFMTESFLINVIAAMLSIGIAYFMLPALNAIVGKELPLSVLQNLEFWVFFLAVVVFGSLLSGLYPAFVLSSFRPISIFHSVNAIPGREFNLRKGLIVFQFLMSVLLLSGTYLIYKQIFFMKDQDLGVDMERILVLNAPRVNTDRESFASRMQTFKTEVVNHHSIFSVTGSGSVPGKGFNMGTTGIRKMGAPGSANQSGRIIFVDFDFIETYDFRFLAGGTFSKAQSFDPEGVIINEEAVEVFGFESPEDAVQRKLIISDYDTVKILGVLKNFHWNSLQNAQSPYLFFVESESSLYFSFKLNLSDIQETIAYIESKYHSVFPGNPFNYFFLDDEFNQQYQADLQFGKLFSAFSILAIFIACLGLFALVSFSTTLRTKEIGIRKILGANIGNLMILLSREYMVLLLIAIIIAIPVIIFGANAWLQNYAFKIGVGMEMILIPGLILLVISLLTVSYRTFATARRNPVKSLKSE